MLDIYYDKTKDAFKVKTIKNGLVKYKSFACKKRGGKENSLKEATNWAIRKFNLIII